MADALDSKSSEVHPSCGFNSHLRHHIFIHASYLWLRSVLYAARAKPAGRDFDQDHYPTNEGLFLLVFTDAVPVCDYYRGISPKRTYSLPRQCPAAGYRQTWAPRQMDSEDTCWMPGQQRDVFMPNEERRAWKKWIQGKFLTYCRIVTRC